MGGQWGLGVDQIIGAEIVGLNLDLRVLDSLPHFKWPADNLIDQLFAGLIVLDSSTKSVA
jgi:hypothetical protein